MHSAKTQPVTLPTPPYYAIIKGLKSINESKFKPNPVDSPRKHTCDDLVLYLLQEG